MIPSNREIASHQIDTAITSIKKNVVGIVRTPRRLFQSATLALALNAAGGVMTAPSADANTSVDSQAKALSVNSADCIGFPMPASGPIEGKMRVSAHRRFMLDGQDVSQSLNGSPEVFNSINSVTGQVQEEVTVGRPTFYDVKFGDQISRSRFAAGAMDTNSYWIQPDANKEMQNVGEVMTFTRPDTGERYTVKNQCGQDEERRGFTVDGRLMFKNGGIEVPLENGKKLILELCVTNDHWTHTATLKPKFQPAPVPTPTAGPTPETDVPPTDFPGQYPAQYTPYSR